MEDSLYCHCCSEPCLLITAFINEGATPMKRVKLDYEPLRAAVARGDSARIEAEARKLRDRHFANLMVRGVTGAWSIIMAIGTRCSGLAQAALRGDPQR